MRAATLALMLLVACAPAQTDEVPAKGDGNSPPMGGSEPPVGIQPQPQPNPNFPPFDLGRVEVREIAPDSLEWTGAKWSTTGVTLRVANVTSPRAIHVATVAADGSFKLTIPGAKHQRFVVVVHWGNDAGLPIQVEAGELTLVRPDECLDAPSTSLDGTKRNASVLVTNRCSTELVLTATAPGATGEPKPVASNMGASLPLALGTPLTAPLIAIVQDDLGINRLGALVELTEKP